MHAAVAINDGQNQVVALLQPETYGAAPEDAVYVVDGVRVIGFDNERGKGDHCHLHGRELPYNFTTIDALVEDFIAAVDAARRTP